MKKTIAATILILSSLSAFHTMAAEDDQITSGLVDNGTFQARSMFIQAESLRVQRQILDNLKILNEQMAEQNNLLKSQHSSTVGLTQHDQQNMTQGVNALSAVVQQTMGSIVSMQVQQAASMREMADKLSKIAPEPTDSEAAFNNSGFKK